LVFTFFKKLDNSDTKKQGPSKTSEQQHIYIDKAAFADASDIEEARNFLRDLPTPCSDSHAYASPDGTVNIRINCSGDVVSMDGEVRIKDGEVLEVK